MRLARMTTRRWMVAVAVLAALLGADQMRRKIQFCRERVSHLREEEDTYLRVAATADEAAIDTRSRLDEFQTLEASEEGRDLASRTPDLFQAMRRSSRSTIRFAEDAKRCRDRARWCGGVRAMYERAIWRPWEPSPTEPPFAESIPSEP
jgi:hypothetical protein